MKSSLGLASLRFCFAPALFGALLWAACDQSNSVGKVGGVGGAGGTSAGLDGGLVATGGATASGVAGGGSSAPVSAGATASAAAGSAVGGTTGPGSAGAGGGTTSGQAGGKAGAAGGSVVDAGAGAAGGTIPLGGAGGTRVDAAVDGHVCPPLTDLYCSNYTTDEYGCTVCAFGGTGGAGGVTSKGGSGGGGTGGNGGSSGAAGSSGTGKACQRRPTGDTICRSRNYPPLAYFCSVAAQPASSRCVAYNGIDSGDEVCCPEQYPACPDGPSPQAGACTGSLVCTYGSHPDPTCRTSAICTNGAWQVRVPPSRCSEALLPATCPTSPSAGTACGSHGQSCAYADGTYCTCSNCTVEDNLCNASAADTWRCWSPPGGDCPPYYPNLGTTCSLPATTNCRYTCAAITTCTAGAWVGGANRCPN